MDSASGPGVLGGLLRSAVALPRSASTDALGTEVFLQVDARALHSPELRQGLAAWAASVRYPGDADARTQDAAQWEGLLADPFAQEFLAGARLTAEQRLRHVAFLLAQPEPRADLLRAYEGDVARCAAHEMLLAVQGLDPSQVAPIVAVPAVVWSQLTERPDSERPGNAEALAALVPDTLAPSRVAEVLVQLADDLSRRLAGLPGDNPPPGPLPEGEGTSTGSTRLGPLVETATIGLRALASGIRAEPEDAQRVAQALVLGAMQHQAFSQALVSLTGGLDAQRTRRELVASGAALVGTALASSVGAAVASLLMRVMEAHEERFLSAGRLPLGAQVLRAPGLSTVSLAAGPLGDAVGELLRLYTSQLGDLGEEAFSLLGEELVGRLTSGEQQGLDAAWAALLDDLARMAMLQDTGAEVRAQLLRVLLVGATLGLLPWESVAPRLHARGPVFFGRTVAVDPSRGALPDVYRASAALAVTALADPFLLEDVHAGLLAPEQAVSQVRARGESLLVDARAPAEGGLAAALLSAMVARE